MTEAIAENKLQAIIAVVAEVLGLSQDEIGPDSSMDNVPTWDSVEQIHICLAFEQRFGIKLDMDMIAASTSVQALAALV